MSGQQECGTGDFNTPTSGVRVKRGYGRTDGWTDGYPDARTDGYPDGRISGWTDGREGKIRI